MKPHIRLHRRGPFGWQARLYESRAARFPIAVIDEATPRKALAQCAALWRHWLITTAMPSDEEMYRRTARGDYGYS
jgi:hypothetical protein